MVVRAADANETAIARPIRATASYDALGRLTDATDDDSTVQMTYDSLLGALTEVQSGDSLGITGKTVSFAWDDDGHRTQVGVPSGFEANESRDALGRIARIEDGASAVVADQADVDGDGNTSEVLRFSFHTQLIGSVTQVTGPSGGVFESYEVDPYGKPTIKDQGASPISASAIGNSYLFTARQLDEETGLYYYRARHDSPELRRFIQRDPLEYVDGANALAYVRANPSSAVDQLGLESTSLGARRGRGNPQRPFDRPNSLTGWVLGVGRAIECGGAKIGTAFSARITDILCRSCPPHDWGSWTTTTEYEDEVWSARASGGLVLESERSWGQIVGATVNFAQNTTGGACVGGVGVSATVSAAMSRESSMITRISVRYECSLRWQDFSVSQEFHEYVTRTCNRCGETETRYKQSGTKTTTVTEVWVEWLNIDPFNSPGVADDEHGRDVGAQYDDGIEGFTFRSGSTTKYR